MSAPTWSPVDPDTGAVLDLVAAPMLPEHEWQWNVYVFSLYAVADDTGRIDPNRLRRLTRGAIKPCRVGPFTRKAIRSGLVAYADDEYVLSDDLASRNAGKPIRVMRLTNDPKE